MATVDQMERDRKRKVGKPATVTATPSKYTPLVGIRVVFNLLSVLLFSLSLLLLLRLQIILG